MQTSIAGMLISRRQLVPSIDAPGHSTRQIAANRRNARKGTGLRSSAGKSRASSNAYRHGLSLSVGASTALAPQLEKLARKIAGNAADAFTLERAREIAQAELDLARYAGRKLV
jgi:hypothetical protein